MKTVEQQYADWFAEYGDCAQGHGWSGEASVAFRKMALLTVFCDMPSQFTALDFGCGTGDFSEDLLRFGLTEYVGVEVVPAIRETAQRRFPQHRFVATLPDGLWDYVFVSGTFNLKADVPNDVWQSWVESQVKALWARTRVALVMNFVTYKPDWREPDLWYPDSPVQIASWVQPVELLVLEDYGLRGEWTLLLRK